MRVVVVCVSVCLTFGSYVCVSGHSREVTQTNIWPRSETEKHQGDFVSFINVWALVGEILVWNVLIRLACFWRLVNLRNKK